MGLLLILAVAFFFGSSQGAQTARNEVGDHYRKGKSERNKGAETAGVSMGALMSTTAHSMGLAARGFKKGWKRGWPKGREWVVDRMNRRRERVDSKAAEKTGKPIETAPSPKPETPVEPDTAKSATPEPPAEDDKPAGPDLTTPAPEPARTDADLVCIHCGEKAVKAKPERPCAESTDESMGQPLAHIDGTALCAAIELGMRIGMAVRPDLVPGHTEPLDGPGLAPVHDITSLKKQDPTPGGVLTMPITTTTAEATNHSALLAALDAIANEASADMDDASADVARSRQEASNIEAMAAGLAELELDTESLGKVQVLVEPFQQRAAAAEQRLASAEQRKAMADDAAQTVTAKHQTMKEAHDATPEAAQKRYYQGD